MQGRRAGVPLRTTAGFLPNSQEPTRCGWLEAIPWVWARVKDDDEGYRSETVELASRLSGSSTLPRTASPASTWRALSSLEGSSSTGMAPEE
jgi:hypothetical protein